MIDRPSCSLADIATRWGCCHSHVLSLVRSGALAAIDISTRPGGRARYIVTAEALDDFEVGRTTRPPVPKQKRRARVRPGEVIQFFS